MTRGLPEVTVVVTTRNRVDVLRDTTQRILDQLDVAISLVVVDEGSSDGTSGFLAELADADSRVRVIRHDPAKGLAAARNAGLAIATTPWTAFCDDDDAWAPDRICSQLTAIAELPGARWSCTGALLVDPSMEIRGHQRPPASGEVAAEMRVHNAVPGGGSGLLAETSLLREIGGYDAWFSGCEDYAMGIALAERSPVASVDRPLVANRVWDSSMSTDVTYMRRGQERVFERWSNGVTEEDHRRRAEMTELFLGSAYVRKRDRFAGFRHYTKLAARFRRPRRLGTALGLLVAPHRVAERHERWMVDAVPESWKREAAGWLASGRAEEMRSQ